MGQSVLGRTEDCRAVLVNPAGDCHGQTEDKEQGVRQRMGWGRHCKVTGGADVRTTLKLSRLPRSLRRDALTDILDQHGFKACYDFVYMPVDFRRSKSCGYAFVNFTTHAHALRALLALSGFDAWGFDSDRRLEAVWSESQGYEPHVERYRNSPVMHHDVPDWCKPVVFQGGARVPFRAPT